MRYRVIVTMSNGDQFESVHGGYGIIGAVKQALRLAPRNRPGRVFARLEVERLDAPSP